MEMRILTGLQPSGKLHIGNYFGAIEPAIRLQEQGDAYYFIANYHAMTSLQDGASLKIHTKELAIDFLACGLDPSKATFFRQSDVPEVHELAWFLSTICPMGLLERCHSYKDKVARGIAANHALFAYPVLMAADILLYDARLVPVGRDQKQHLEVTRDLANKINEQMGENTVTVPDALIRDESAVVPGIDGQKMSKSYQNTIPLFGDEKALRKLFMKIVTDSCSVEDPKPTENSTILQLYRLFAADASYEQMIDDFKSGGVGYGDLKKRLWEAYWETFAPMRERRLQISNNDQEVDRILATGAAKARDTASCVLKRVRAAFGCLHDGR